MAFHTAVLALFLLLQNAALEKQAFRAYRDRNWAAAVRYYEAFHNSGGGDAATYDHLGVALTSLGQWAQAESAFRHAIALDPHHRWAYNHLGFVLREEGQHQEAVRMFRRQIEIAPTDPYAYRNLAALLALLGDLKEAEEAAAANEKYTYERGAVYIDMACSLNSRNRPGDAKKYLEKAQAAGVERSLLAQESAHYFLTIREYRRAEEQYLKLLEYQPYEPLVALRIGTFYWSTGNLEKSAAAFARVITVDDNDQVTIRTSANTSKTFPLARLRDDPGAGGAVLGDVPVDLGRAAMLVRLSRYKTHEARFAQLCREFLAASNPPPVEAWLREALGRSLLEGGRTAEAIAELQKAQALAPGRRITAWRLGAALEKSDDREKALAEYVRSLAPEPPGAIDCGCENPGLATREKLARALYAKLKGRASDFDAYRAQVLSKPPGF